MNTKSLLVLILTITCNYAFAQTTIPSGNVSGTWTKAASPYKIQGEITVPLGSSLNLEPGTILEFQGMYGLTVDGILKAEGKKGDSITFTSPFNKTWAGILYNKNTQSDTISFNYCKWLNVGNARRKYKGQDLYVRDIQLALNKAILVLRSSPVTVKHASFYFTRGDSVQANLISILKSSYVKFDSIKVTSNANAISRNTSMLSLDSVPYFMISNIEVSGLKDFVSFLYIDASKGGTLTKPTILANLLFKNCPKINCVNIGNTNNSRINNIDIDNALGGFGLYNSRNCRIKDVRVINSKTAIGASGTNFQSVFENCNFEKCGDIIGSTFTYSANFSGDGPLMYNCRFIDSKIGITINQKNGNGKPWFLNCIFDNSAEKMAEIEGYPVFINCNIQNNINQFSDGLSYLGYLGGVSIGREFDDSKPYFYNSLFWGNHDTIGHYNSIAIAGKDVEAVLDNCIVQNDSNEGIISIEENYPNARFSNDPAQLTYTNSSGIKPGFKDSAAGDYTLKNTCSETAYAINRGMKGNLLTQYPFNVLLNNYGINIYEAKDLNGNPRVMDDTIDIGCYESSGSKTKLDLRTDPNDTTLCLGRTAAYEAKHVGSVQQYKWQQKQGNTVTTIGSNRDITVPGGSPLSGSRQYRLFVSNSECLPLKDSSDWFTLTVNPAAKKGIAKSPNKDTIMLKDTITFSTNASGYNNIKWSTGQSGSNVKVKGQDLGALGSHMITVEAIDANGCIERDTLYIITKANSSLKSILNKQVMLYPQPAGNTLTIASETALNAEVYVLGMDGRVLLTEHLNSNSNTISTQSLQSGLYILKLRTADGREMAATIVKE